MAESDIVRALVDTQGELYSEAMGADLSKDTPQELFHWLIGVVLLSARIDAERAVQAGRALREAGLHKIDAILASEEETRIRILNENGYARFDNQGAERIHATADLVRERYGGDLRRLRDAGGDGDAILGRLQEVKGIGPSGAGIFAREAQMIWDALFPRLDGPGSDTASDLGLPSDAKELAQLAGGRARYARLAAALTRAALEGPSEAVKRAAG